MTTQEKARKADSALRQLRSEEWIAGNNETANMINNFLADASIYTKAKLFDLITAP